MGAMRKSRLSSYKQGRLIEHFVAGTTARTASSLCGVNRKTAAFYFYRLREIIAHELEAENEAMFGGEIVVVISDFHHFRINHFEFFSDKQNHINGIEVFWNQAKRQMRKFNGVPKARFGLFLKECEWRFNNSDPAIQLSQLRQWVKRHMG